MIYIFDDRFERKDNYAPIINRYPRNVSYGTIDQERIEQFEIFVNKHLDDLSLFLLHASYRFPGDKLNVNDIINVLSSKGIPIVLFSGGYHNPNIRMQGKYTIFEVNSDTMYQNLEVFIKRTIEDKNSPIDILLWGEDYINNQILRAQSEIIRYISDKFDFNEDLIDLLKSIVQNRLGRIQEERIQSFCKNIDQTFERATANSSIEELVNSIIEQFDAIFLHKL